MPLLIETPTHITGAGGPPKLIEEFVGRRTGELSNTEMMATYRDLLCLRLGLPAPAPVAFCRGDVGLNNRRWRSRIGDVSLVA